MGQDSHLPVRPGWQGGGLWAACLIAIYAALACLPVVLAWALTPLAQASLWRILGRGTALLGFSLMALQFALAGRFKAVDRPFGLDAVMRFHKRMGMCACALLLAHPVFLVIDFPGFWLLSLKTPWQINLGKIGLALLVLAVAFALLFKTLRVDYHIWRASHKVVLAALALGFVHSLAIGSSFRAPGLRAYWWALFAATALVFLYRNAFVPLWGRRRLHVVGVGQETHDTYTVALEPVDGKPLPHAPGQFWFLKLRRPGRPSEEHPFTISSSPTGEPPMTSTIKESGDYTRTIGQTRPGDEALAEGPYGRFSFVHHSPEAFLFIAGGVGITPILSMLCCLRDTDDPRPAVLIYGNKTEDDIICRQEINALPGHAKVVHVLEDPPEGWQGPVGRVTAEVVREHAGDVLDKAHVFLCGPPPMMNAVARALKSLGVPGQRVHSERFAL